MDKYYLAAAAAVVPGLGRSHLQKAVTVMGSAKAVFEATAAELGALKFLSQRSIDNFVRGRIKINPVTFGEQCQAKGIEILSFFDDDYPVSLKEIYDPPLVLYVRGHLPRDGYNIAIVGSRLSTPYGLKATRFFAKSLTAGNIIVVSGGAQGIDSAAHAAVLEAGGITVAVLGCGVDVVYPQQNKGLFEGIVEKGAIVSEYPPGTPVSAYNFPARNRIIVGLSRGVIICEAAAKSGALITARIAVDEHREVYCVPGNIFEPTSVGCHSLIQQGAKLLNDPREIFFDKDEYDAKLYVNDEKEIIKFNGYNGGFRADYPSGILENKQIKNLPPLEKKIYDLLCQGPISQDNLIEQTGADFASVSMAVLNLQVMRLADMDQTKKYYLV